jgi:hypothetical protein
VARIRLPQKVQSADREINDVQAGVHDTLRQISYYAQLTGQWVQGVSATTSGVAINHGLGRTPIGWYVTDILDAGSVYRSAWDDKTLTLKSNSGTVRVDVFIW